MPSERRKEIKRRRHRRKQIIHLKTKIEKASPSEKVLLAEKLRSLTPGGEVILATIGVKE